MITYTIKHDKTIVLHKDGNTHFALNRKQFFELSQVMSKIERCIYADIHGQMLKDEQES